MRSILPFDELNKFSSCLRQRYPSGKLLPPKDSKEQDDYEDTLDEMLDLFLLSYTTANSLINEGLMSDWKAELDEVMETVDKKVAGKTWRERVSEYFENGGSVEDLTRIAETETHRIANESALRTAVKAGATTKQWLTMLDDKVRDTHSPLEGQTIPIDAEFYTWDGDKAQAPGLFEYPENNVNCRCELRFK